MMYNPTIQDRHKRLDALYRMDLWKKIMLMLQE